MLPLTSFVWPCTTKYGPAINELLTVPVREQLELVKVKLPVSAKVPSAEAAVAWVKAIASVTFDPPEPVIGPFHVALIEGTGFAVRVPLSPLHEVPPAMP